MNKCEDCSWFLFDVCHLFRKPEDCESFEELLIDPNDYVPLSLEEGRFGGRII